MHVEQALEVTDFDHGPVGPQTPRPTADNHVERLVECDKFTLDRWTLTQPQSVAADEIFQLRPISDDRPFFFHVLRWGQLFLDNRVEWSNPGAVTGQIVLLMMLGQAVLLGGGLITLPLLRAYCPRDAVP